MPPCWLDESKGFMSQDAYPSLDEKDPTMSDEEGSCSRPQLLDSFMKVKVLELEFEWG